MNKDERAFVAEYIFYALGYLDPSIPFNRKRLRNPLELRRYAYRLLDAHGAKYNKGPYNPLYAFLPGGGHE